MSVNDPMDLSDSSSSSEKRSLLDPEIHNFQSNIELGMNSKSSNGVSVSDNNKTREERREEHRKKDHECFDLLGYLLGRTVLNQPPTKDNMVILIIVIFAF